MPKRLFEDVESIDGALKRENPDARLEWRKLYEEAMKYAPAPDDVEAMSFAELFEFIGHSKRFGLNQQALPVSPYQGIPLENMVEAIDGFYGEFDQEDVVCKREPIGKGVRLVFYFGKKEIGRVLVMPLPEKPGFNMTEYSTSRGDERKLWAEIMSDLDWYIQGKLGLRPPGVRYKGKSIDLRESLPGLSENQKSILMRWRNEITAVQIAKDLALAQGTVRNELTKLRDKFGDGVVPVRNDAVRRKKRGEINS